MSLDIGSGAPPGPLYERVGGHDFFERLVDEFYDRVEADAELLSHYPDVDDLQGARDRLRMFLEQFWGCLLYTSPSPRDRTRSRMPSSA